MKSKKSESEKEMVKKENGTNKRRNAPRQKKMWNEGIKELNE